MKANSWVSVKDDLPFPGVLVHVYQESGEIDIAYYDDTAKEWMYPDGRRMKNVIMWCNIKPPQKPEMEDV